ncbi:thiolase family protein [Actinomadura madurae]|uniref:thiolase family protein n=1 Tax=Actinomadura madurae TaxID=1993 RepID=UPI0020267E73|nr:thiolase family protein [Actinomadura madurae]MCP9948204.1 thiolase family protein [Actinomadura madurae]MCP9964975.1 thiolase family protein [Actinomadura madurae]MCP9977466.1 thiolase family protein [Actinomadura madurae]URN04591.1 thiolase family protein [Actinomadura madurae]
MSADRTAVIAGLGLTEFGRIYGRTPADFAIEAIAGAAEDAGLALPDIDGLLVNPGVGNDIDLRLQSALQMRDTRVLATIQSFGSSAGQMVQYASMAIASGMADVVACVYADAPLKEGKSAGASYAGQKRAMRGVGALPAAAGLKAAPERYAVAARRHMNAFGTTSEQFGAVAVAARQWAAMNPRAQKREPITLADHQDSRMIADPLRLLDCCLVSNGAVAVILTSADRAAALRRPPVHVWGWGQAHPGYANRRGSEFGLVTGAARSGADALKMAGVGVGDIDVREIYDCFTYTTLVTLEDYGFCAKGEGGDFVASGAIAPGGSHPTNTGGGELSSYYMWGMTPLSEAIIQARGDGGERQVPNHDLIMVSGNGGVLDFHSTLVLSPHPKSA